MSSVSRMRTRASMHGQGPVTHVSASTTSTKSASLKKRVSAASKTQPAASVPLDVTAKVPTNVTARSVTSVRSRSEVVFRSMEERSLLTPAESVLLKQFSQQSPKHAADLTSICDYIWTRYIEPSCPAPTSNLSGGDISSEQLQKYIDMDEQVNDFIECKTRLPNHIKRQLVLYLAQTLQDPSNPRVPSQADVDVFVQNQVAQFRNSNLSREKQEVQRLLQKDQAKMDKLSQDQADVIERIHQLTVRIQQINTNRQTLMQTMSSKPVPVLDEMCEEWLTNLHDWAHKNTNSDTGNGLKADTIAVLTLIHTNLDQEIKSASAVKTDESVQSSASDIAQRIQRAQKFKVDIERILFPPASA